MLGRSLALAVLTLGLATGPAHAVVPPPAVLDADFAEAGSVAIAPDGTGAATWVKTVAGDDRVFVATLVDGSWDAPVVVDPDTGDDERSPRVAVGNGGRVLVGYLDNDGQTLRWRLLPGARGTFTPQATMRTAGAANAIGDDWDLDMAAGGVAYAAWNEYNSGTMKRDVRAWRLDGVTGANIAALQPGGASADHDPGGPNVRVSADENGNGAVVFGHDSTATVFRRLNGTTPGPVVDVEVGTVYGASIVGSHHRLGLELAADGRAWFAAAGEYGAGSHIVGRPITGSTAGPASVLDGHPGGSAAAPDWPVLSLGPDGTGLLGMEVGDEGGAWANRVGDGAASAPTRLDTTTLEANANERTSAAAGAGGTGLVAWNDDPVGPAPNVVRARVAGGGAFAEPPITLSPTGRILGTNGDPAAASRLGDAAVLVTTDGNNLAIARYDAPPTVPVITGAFSWTPSEALWSPVVGYRVLVDEQPVATTTGTSVPAPSAGPGTHTWRVVALDASGGETASAPSAFTVPAPPAAAPPAVAPNPAAPRDRTKPTAALKLRRKGRRVTFTVAAADRSGIRSVVLSFGKKGMKAIRRTKKFTITKRLRRGRYKLVLTVTDKAGNKKVVRRSLTIR